MDTEGEKQPPAPTLITVEVEVCLHSASTARPSEVRDRVRDVLERACKGGGAYRPGAIPASVLRADDLLARHVHHARICEIVAPDASRGAGVYLQSAGYWESDLQMCVLLCAGSVFFLNSARAARCPLPAVDFCARAGSHPSAIFRTHRLAPLRHSCAATCTS